VNKLPAQKYVFLNDIELWVKLIILSAEVERYKIHMDGVDQ
jgi:hypothetical protein